MRLTEFAAAVGATIDNLAEDFEIKGITTLDKAQRGELSFVAGERFAAQAKETKASALIVDKKLSFEGIPTVAMPEPWAGVLYLLQRLHPPRPHVYYSGTQAAFVHPDAQVCSDVALGPNAVIGPRARIGARTVIGPNCVVEPECVIGEDCLIYGGVYLGHGSRIGNGVIIHAGAVIGADGFKYEILNGRRTKIPQVGRVVIKDRVEIGANTCIDRASFAETRIGANTKIDNLVQIGHNVSLGADFVIVSQSGVAGSTQIGDNCILAAQAGIADNLTLGKNVVVLAKAGVKDDIPARSTVIGQPARPFREAARIMAAQARLPELASELAKLRERVEELEKRQEAQSQ